LVEPIFEKVESGFEIILPEAKLCRNLLDKMKADVVHLDMSLGSVSIEEYRHLSSQPWVRLKQGVNIF